MKLLLDFLPIVLFFVSFKWAGHQPDQALALIAPVVGAMSTVTLQASQVPILLATVVAIAITVVQIVVQRLMGKPVENMQWVGLALIVVFGGATLVFQNETFIKLKPTVLYVAMALGFLVAYALRKNPVELMMKGQVDLPPAAWGKLLWSWVAFFLLMAVLNVLVAYNFSTDIWVDFKLFGSLGATILFVVGQGVYMSKHMATQGDNAQ